ncbi:Uncharacterised protein [Mycobacteroides abscessus subsp. abscessus]|nr:Uncharacterised protein [Mycobacteroides abscessus subsp. abscessus]
MTASDADVARVAGPSTVRRTVSADTVGENGSMGRSIGPVSSSQWSANSSAAPSRTTRSPLLGISATGVAPR